MMQQLNKYDAATKQVTKQEQGCVLWLYQDEITLFFIKKQQFT